MNHEFLRPTEQATKVERNTNFFFELIQISLGNKTGFERLPSKEEWQVLYDLACKQSLESFLLEGVNRLKSANINLILDINLLLEWIGVGLQTENQNKIQNERAKQLADLFAKNEFRSCILKGQGTALYYDKPERRQCGDIDIWVEGDRDRILDFVRLHGLNIGHIDIKHSDIEFFEDVPVEVHFLPSWMYCPSTNKRLQEFFASKAERQFANFDEKVGFAHTTVDFDLVYSMVHIYRHIFSEGIGLRQLVDYCYILLRSTEEQRNEAFETLCRLQMKSFVGGVMWILGMCFGMQDSYMLCPVNERHGEFLLSEIMTSGSFGHFDDRFVHLDKEKRFARGFIQLKRNLRFVTFYPSEVLWSPFWKIWHWCWRKKKGYL